MKKYFYQTEKIEVANGTAAGSEDLVIVLQPDFPTVSGIIAYLHNTKTGGAAVQKFLTIKNAAGTIQDETPLEDFQASTSVAPDVRYKSYNLPAAGRKITVNCRWDDALTADMEINIVLKHEREDGN